MPDYPALDRLIRALNPLPGAAVDGAHWLTVTGTISTANGGSGGTSATDEATFTTGATSLTPVGAINLGFGAQAGASMNTGQVGAMRMSGQRILYTSIATPSGGDAMDNTNAALRVNVVAGGAGGGVANLTVQGTNNTAIHVGFASGVGSFADGGGIVPVTGAGTFTIWYGGIGADLTNSAVRVNVVAGAAGGGVANTTVRGTANTDIHVGYASGAAGADGNIAMPVIFGSGYYASINPIIGSVNITGSINPVGIFGSVGVFGSVQVVGSVNITGSINPVGVFGSVNVVGSVNITGGVVASLAAVTVRGTANTDIHVGYASGAAGADGNIAMPVIFGSGYYASINPIVGSVNITGSLNPVGVFGSMGVFGSVVVTGSVNITGSINPVGIFGSVGVFGSVNSLASLAGVGVPASQGLPVDPRNNITATQWIISGNASGQFNVCPTVNANLRAIITGFHLTADATTAFQWCSPSGTAISGSMVLLPGAGFAVAGAFPNGMSVMGALQGVINIRALNGSNVGGIAIGYVGTP